MENLDIDLSSAQMAVVLGVTERRVRQLASEGIVQRAGRRGRYRLVPSVASYIATLTSSERDVGLGPIRQERLVRLRMENAARDRELISLEEASGVVDQLVGTFVSSLNGLPAQITRDPRERRRLESIIDGERQRLADKFSELTAALESGAQR